MRLLTITLSLTLLWGSSALLPTESAGTSAPVPQTGSRSSTARPNDATARLNASRVPGDESQTQVSTGGPRPQTAATAGAAETAAGEADVSSAAYGSASRWSHVFTSATEATTSHSEATAGGAEPEPTASTGMTTGAAAPLPTSGSSAASSASAAASPLEATSTAGPGPPQNLSSTDSSDYLTHPSPSVQSFSSPSASGSTNATNRTVEAPPALDPTSPPVLKPETATTRAGPPSSPQPVSDAQTPTSTSEPPDTTGPSSSPGSPAPSDSAAFSSSSAGVFIRPVSRFVPAFTTKPAAASTAAPRASRSPSTTGVQPCSSRGLVTQCLVVIASLAGLATVFMVSTVVLCAKLSARKYKARKPREETEMMCISSLLPERNHTYARQHNPVSNGVLVLPMGADSDDDDMGDNLTLSSFLPENERTV